MKKNVLIAVYDMEIGGIERSLINMLESFDYDSYNVDVLIYEHKGELLRSLPQKARLLPELKAYSVFRKPIKQCLKEGYISTSIMRVFSKYMAVMRAKKKAFNEGSGYIQMQLALRYSMVFLPQLKKRYDVAISYAWPHDLVAKKIIAKKKIAWVHTDYSQLEVDEVIDFNMWNQFDSIAAVSQECSKAFLSAYPLLKNKVFIMENINSPGFIEKMANEPVNFPNATNETFKIVSIGRLSYAKGFDLAIQALRKLHDQGMANIYWYVVGYGPEERALLEEIKKYRLTNCFILLGKQNNPYPYLKSANLYVQPSRYEGKAVTVTEAKILGKPILITNYPTAKSQILHDYDGMMAELTVEGLVEGIEKLYKDTSLRERLAQTCQSTNYSNEYELEKLYEKIKDLETDPFEGVHKLSTSGSV